MFFINIPIGIAVVLGFLLLQPGTSREPARSRLDVDVPGLLQFTGVIVALMVGMTLIADGPAQARDPLVWGLFVVSVALAMAFVRHARQAANPVMEYRLLARPPFVLANLYNLLVRRGHHGLLLVHPVLRGSQVRADAVHGRQRSWRFIKLRGSSRLGTEGREARCAVLGQIVGQDACRKFTRQQPRQKVGRRQVVPLD